MAIFGFLKKKGAPGELPDLAMDEIEDRLKDSDSFKNQDGSQAPSASGQKPGSIPQPPQSAQPAAKQNPSPGSEKTSPETPKQPEASDSDSDESMSEEEQDAEEIKKALNESQEGDEPSDKSFFNELQKNISEEISDPEKIGDWFENKFASKDILAEMRNYWERKKINSMMQVLGKNFKERINEKTSKLQGLEKEWQEIYFQLIEKEEEIREEEAELKEDLSEFVELCKKRKKSVSHGQRKTKEKTATKR